jgi:hypothetical protein
VANLLTEGFDWFPTGQTTTVRNRLWSANSFYKYGVFSYSDSDADVTAPGRFGFGNAMHLNAGNPGGNNYIGYVVPFGSAGLVEGYMGAALFVYTRDAGGNIVTGSPQISFYDGVNNHPQVSICFDANGAISVWQGDRVDNFPLGKSIAGVFQKDEWFHFEARAIIAAVGGFVEIRINTVPVVQITGANTLGSVGGLFDSVLLGGWVNNNTVDYDIDDFFVNDTTGTYNNSWLGNVRVKTQLMIANGNQNDFTIGGSSPAPTHWQSVLNNILDDTKYEFSATVGQIDLFTPDPNLNSPLVHVVQVRMGLRQDDATQREAHAMLRISGTNYEGVVGQFTNQTYTMYRERFEVNPFTGVAFTGGNVNGLQAGVKVVA